MKTSQEVNAPEAIFSMEMSDLMKGRSFAMLSYYDLVKVIMVEAYPRYHHTYGGMLGMIPTW